jgi:AraC-like DNA-binding protein/quercetin dioxygenase-like cupin family protein
MKSQKAANPSKADRAPEFFSADVARVRRFYLDLNPSENETLTVVCGGLEHCTPDYIIHRETFPFYSIEYVARGRGEVKLKDQTHRLEAGRIFTYGPGVPHRITGSAADPLVKYFVDFAGREAGALLRSCGLTLGRVAQVHPPNALQALFDELIESGLRSRRVRSELCARLLACLGLKARAARVPVEGPETLAFQTYQQCRQHIDRHFRELRTLEQIAAECHVNDAYLCRLFRRYDHQTPYQHLLRLKMSLAAEQLQLPGCLVKQVAESAGFADAFHFSRVFKRVFGLAPNAFRRMR